MHEISRDELLRYVEIDLWSRFQRRLWLLVGGILTATAVVSLIGVPYYIRSEVERRLAEQQRAFTIRNQELLLTTHAVATRRLQYNEARLELYRRGDALLRALTSANPQASTFGPREFTVSALQNLDSYHGFFMPARMTMGIVDPSLLNAHLRTSTFLVDEKPEGDGVAASLHAHPVQNGTVSGGIADLHYRMVELEAFRQALEELDRHLQQFAPMDSKESALGESSKRASATSPGYEPTVSSAFISADQFYSRYEGLRPLVAKRLLSSDELQRYDRVQSLYALIKRTGAREK